MNKSFVVFALFSGDAPLSIQESLRVVLPLLNMFLSYSKSASLGLGDLPFPFVILGLEVLGGLNPLGKSNGLLTPGLVALLDGCL